MTAPTTLDPELLELLRCPACRARFADPAATQEPPVLECSSCGRRYPVRNGVPVLLVDEASGPEDREDAPRTGPED